MNNSKSAREGLQNAVWFRESGTVRKTGDDFADAMFGAVYFAYTPSKNSVSWKIIKALSTALLVPVNTCFHRYTVNSCYFTQSSTPSVTPCFPL